MDVQPGHILLCTEVYAAVIRPDPEDNPNRISEPVWARVTHIGGDERDQIYVEWMSVPDVPDECGENVDYLVARYDRFKVVPEADVPDEVWAMIVKRALLGELTNGDS